MKIPFEHYKGIKKCDKRIKAAWVCLAIYILVLILALI